MLIYGGELRQVFRKVLSWRQFGMVLILLVGLTLAAIMFAVGYGYSYRSIPYKDAEQLVIIGRSFPNTRALYLDVQRYFDLKEREDILTEIAAFTSGDTCVVTAPDGNVHLSTYKATENFFDVLGVSFAGLETWKRSSGADGLYSTVLTHDIGVKKFGYSSVGEIFPDRKTGNNVIINGILPSNFIFPYETYLGETPEGGFTRMVVTRSNDEFSNVFSVIGRLAPGITPGIIEQALFSATDEEAALTASFGPVTAKPLLDYLSEQSRPVVLGSYSLCGLLLILCVANTSGILLLRCVYQLREYALRTSLGAGFFDLIRLLLAEMAVVSIIVTALAWTTGRAAINVIGNHAPTKYLGFGRPGWGWETTVFLIIAMFFTVFLSVIPAIAVIAKNYRKGFPREQMASFSSYRRTRITLTAAQTVIAMLLLSLSYIAIRGYLEMFNRNAGLDTSVRIITVDHSSEIPASAGDAMIEGVLNVLRGGNPASPVAVSTGRLFNNAAGGIPVFFPEQSKPTTVMGMSVSTEFFRTVKVKFLAGRDFNDRELDRVMIINASFARRMGWTPSEAIGRQIREMLIIGVVNDFLVTAGDDAFQPLTFTPHTRSKETYSEARINYIFHPDAAPGMGLIERTIMQADPGAVIVRNVLWSEMIGTSVQGRTLATVSVSIFTIVSMVIVIAGIVSTVMFIVARRTRDIAIIRAIGARPGHVCWFVMSDMVKAGVAGVLSGSLVSWWVWRIAAHLVYNGDQYRNPVGLMLTAAAMLAIIAFASLVPALLALRIAPGRALTME